MGCYIDVDDVHIGRKLPLLKRLWKTDVPLTMTGVLMLPALAIAAVGLIVDPRLITGAPAWLKPAKFALSIAIYVFTLAWMFTFIPGFKKTRRIVGWVTAIVMVLELSIISLQAWRGTTRHFNFSTRLNAALFAVMGMAIVLQTVASIAIAIALWREKFEDQALGWALRLAMIITIIGAFSGGLMTRPTTDQLAAAHGGAYRRRAGRRRRNPRNRLERRARRLADPPFHRPARAAGASLVRMGAAAPAAARRF
jgi:hypothetical protein